MRRRFVLAAGILVLLTVTVAWAQAPSVPKYDMANEVTIKGVVQEVKDFQCPVSGGMGAHLVVKTSDKNTVTVHLALSKFLSEYGFNFAKGDELEITGVKAKVGDDENAILARKIERGNQTFIFRDKSGKPLW
jgi:DNA/RNA endonuclease YhcR with UshA esterase domain